MVEQRPQVFVIDDHPGMRGIIVRFVHEEADVIGMASTAEEALQAELVQKADVVLVDVSLPRMSGIDLVRALLERWPHLRCLMLSGHDSMGYVQRSLEAGAWGYIRKEDPFELLEAIRHVRSGEIFIGAHFRDELNEGGP